MIPYRTSYHNENWGFCLPHEVAESLPEGDYHVGHRIDARRRKPHLRGHVLAGESDDEVLLSTYICHPSLATTTSRGSCC